MNSQNKKFLRFSKNYISRVSYDKLREIKEDNELEHSMRAALRTAIETEYNQLKEKIEKNEKEKDMLLASIKLMNISSKIKYVKIDYTPKEVKKLFNLFNALNKEIENV